MKHNFIDKAISMMLVLFIFGCFCKYFIMPLGEKIKNKSESVKEQVEFELKNIAPDMNNFELQFEDSINIFEEKGGFNIGKETNYITENGIFK